MRSIELCGDLVLSVLLFNDRASVWCLAVQPRSAPSASFDAATFKTAMQSTGECICMLNFTWVDWKYSTAPGVPLLQPMIKDYAAKNYPPGGPLTKIELTIGVEGNSSPATQRGSLKAVTPQEEIFAVYWALGSQLEADSLTQADVEMWRSLLLTCQATFKILKNEEAREFESIAIRQAAHNRFTAIVYTPVQWVCKIVQMRNDRQGKASCDEIAKLFKDHNFKPAKGQEEISGTFVKNACYIWDHALCYSEVHDVLIRGAERFSHNSMFDSLSKIAEIIRKCGRDGTKVKWVFGLMLDRVQDKYMSIGDCSQSNFFGNSSKKGEIDVLLSMLDLKDHLLYEFAPGLGLPGPVLKTLQANLECVSAYRKKVPECDESGVRPPCDLAWMATWTLPRSGF